MLAVGLLKQLRVALQRRRERSFDRHEKQDEIQTLQPLKSLIVLERQALQMVAQGLHVLLECQHTAAFILGADHRLVGGQADLGVHHDLLVAGQLNQDVGLKAFAIGALETDLSMVFAAFFEAGMLEHPFEDQLAPVALSLLPLQRASQVGRFITEALIELLQPLQLLGQGKALTRLVLVALLDTLLE